MAKEKPGFYIWFKTVDVMSELTFEEKGMLYTAMAEYARDGIVPTFADRLLRSIWTQLQYDLNADNERYMKVKTDNQIKGWKSDFKRNYAPKHGIDPNDEEALQAYIEMRQQQSTAVDNGQPQSTNNNINTNNNSNNNINNRESDNNNGQPQLTPAPLTLGRFKNVLLTEKQLEALKAEFPGKWQDMIEKFSAKLEGNGYQYKNHYAKMVEWATEDAQKEAEKPKLRLDWGNAEERDYSGDQVPW